MRRNDRGFTLIEVLVSMLIMAVGLLGSLLGVTAAMTYNLENGLRNEAIQIAQEQLEAVRSADYTAVADAGPTTVQRKFRNGTRSFSVTRTVQVNTILKMVQVTVQWSNKQKAFQYTEQTIVRP